MNIDKPTFKITNWSIVSNGNSPYQAPEWMSVCLYGDAIDHPYPGLNEDVRTSRIVTMNLKGRMVETKNSIYLLEGLPDQKWIAYLEAIKYDLSKLPE
jgi:hypothetical protein